VFRQATELSSQAVDMKLASLIFFVLLIYAHQLCGLYEPLGQPLCAFREGELPSLGYSLFCSIALIGVLYAFALRRLGQPGEAANTVGMGVLFLIVAATPARWTLHNASAFVLLTSIYAYFAILLHRSGRPLMMLVHLSVPLLLAVATGFQSYGLWQKCLIGYLVVAAMVHHHLVARSARASAAADPIVVSKERRKRRVNLATHGRGVTTSSSSLRPKKTLQLNRPQNGQFRISHPRQFDFA
jgi:hypothetical protein